jgi:hypothetical protein
MKKLLAISALLLATSITAQYTRYFKGYTRDAKPELQLTFIPLSVSNDEEVNQFELAFRKGAHALSFRYGIDNSRTNYFDVNAQAYFWLTKYFDATAGFGFGTRTNLNFDTKSEYDRYYIPYNIGIIFKPSDVFQVITRIDKLDYEHDFYWQTGIIIKISSK